MVVCGGSRLRTWPPSRPNRIDLSRKSSAELVESAVASQRLVRAAGRRLLAERCDQSVVPALTTLALDSDDERLALQGLWSLYVVGALDAQLAEKALASRHEYVRAWTIRLLGDDRIVSPALLRQFVDLARRDTSVVVRSQLACTAKRLPAGETIPIVEQLLGHDEDADDVQMPLLIWWAIEDKAISDTDRVLQMVQAGDLWHRPLMTRFIIERLARRFLSEGTNASAAACAILLQHARQKKTVDLVLSGNVAGTLRTKTGPRPRAA